MMISFAPIIATALLAGFATAIPMPDSGVGSEKAVSASYETPMTDTSMLMGTSGSKHADSRGSSGVLSGSLYGDMTSMANAPMHTSVPMMESSSMMMDSTSTAMATSTYSTPSYGSGSSNWGGSVYDNCVQQCVASYGSMGSYMPTATASMGSSGTGATHTVIVAPSAGVLRYVPFAVNASIGDTIKFMWGADNHTVTKSSQLALCNKTSDAPFASGEQNKSFVFTQVVNDTNPTFFYCGTPGHCEKGMFGIINPPMANQSSASVAAMMPAMIQNSSTMAAMNSYTSMQTMNNTMAASWGSYMDMTNIPTWAQPHMIENTLYTRLFMASNPETIGSDGSINLSNAGGTPYVIPTDITKATNNAASASSSASTPSATSTSTASVSSSASPAGAAKTNAARSLGSPSVLVGIIGVLGAFLAL